jgi:hypothetical protein
MDPPPLPSASSLSLAAAATSDGTALASALSANSGMDSLPPLLDLDNPAASNSKDPDTSSLANNKPSKAAVAKQWHTAIHTLILLPENLAQYTINRTIDAQNKKAQAQTKLLDKVIGAVGAHCNWRKEKLNVTKNLQGKPAKVSDVGLMTGRACSDEITHCCRFLKDYCQVCLDIQLTVVLWLTVAHRIQSMLWVVTNKNSTIKAICKAENKMQTMKAAGGAAPPVVSFHNFYMASKHRWSTTLKPLYIQLHGQEPTRPGTMGERACHCWWFWENQETSANKKAITAVYERYKKDHQRMWDEADDLLDTATGNALGPVQCQV